MHQFCQQKQSVVTYVTLLFDEVDAANAADSSLNLAFGYYTLQYNQLTSPNTQVLLEKQCLVT